MLKSKQRCRQKPHVTKHQFREHFRSLLQDSTFVDYFNVFLNLPVFGQRVLFKLHGRNFVFNPPAGAELPDDRVIDWIQEKRFSLFKKTSLAYEYQLCCKLQEVRFSFRFPNEAINDDAPSLFHVFTANLIGNAAGMFLFREYLRGTCGARVLQCWMHVQAFRKTVDAERRLELFCAIRRHYFKPVISLPDPPSTADIIAADILNFPVMPCMVRSVSSRLGRHSDMGGELDPRSELALQHMQHVLLMALQSYWLPCYMFHVLSSQTFDVLKELFKRSPKEVLDLTSLKTFIRQCSTFNVFHPSSESRGSEATDELDTDHSMPYRPSFTVSDSGHSSDWEIQYPFPEEPWLHPLAYAESSPSVSKGMGGSTSTLNLMDVPSEERFLLPSWAIEGGEEPQSSSAVTTAEVPQATTEDSLILSWGRTLPDAPPGTEGPQDVAETSIVSSSDQGNQECLPTAAGPNSFESGSGRPSGKNITPTSSHLPGTSRDEQGDKRDSQEKQLYPGASTSYSTEVPQTRSCPTSSPSDSQDAKSLDHDRDQVCPVSESLTDTQLDRPSLKDKEDVNDTLCQKISADSSVIPDSPRMRSVQQSVSDVNARQPASSGSPVREDSLGREDTVHPIASTGSFGPPDSKRMCSSQQSSSNVNGRQPMASESLVRDENLEREESINPKASTGSIGPPQSSAICSGQQSSSDVNGQHPETSGSRARDENNHRKEIVHPKTSTGSVGPADAVTMGQVSDATEQPRETQGSPVRDDGLEDGRDHNTCSTVSSSSSASSRTEGFFVHPFDWSSPSTRKEESTLSSSTESSSYFDMKKGAVSGQTKLPFTEERDTSPCPRTSSNVSGESTDQTSSFSVGDRRQSAVLRDAARDQNEEGSDVGTGNGTSGSNRRLQMSSSLPVPRAPTSNVSTTHNESSSTLSADSSQGLSRPLNGWRTIDLGRGAPSSAEISSFRDITTESSDCFDSSSVATVSGRRNNSPVTPSTLYGTTATVSEGSSSREHEVSEVSTCLQQSVVSSGPSSDRQRDKFSTDTVSVSCSLSPVSGKAEEPSRDSDGKTDQTSDVTVSPFTCTGTGERSSKELSLGFSPDTCDPGADVTDASFATTDDVSQIRDETSNRCSSWSSKPRTVPSEQSAVPAQDSLYSSADVSQEVVNIFSESDLHLSGSASSLSVGSSVWDSDTLVEDPVDSTVPKLSPKHTLDQVQSLSSSSPTSVTRSLSSREKKTQNVQTREVRPDDPVSSFSEVSLSGITTSQVHSSGSNETNNYSNLQRNDNKSQTRMGKKKNEEGDSRRESTHSQGVPKRRSLRYSKEESNLMTRTMSSRSSGTVFDSEGSSSSEDDLEDTSDEESEDEFQKKESILVKRFRKEMRLLRHADIFGPAEAAPGGAPLENKEWSELNSLIFHYIFGSRDIKRESAQVDRRTLCLLACDSAAGSPLRKHMTALEANLHKNYLDFWNAMRRYLQLQAFCHLDEVVGQENSSEIHKLVQQQIQHIAHTFLTSPFHGVSILTPDLKLRVLEDMLSERQSTLISTTMDVVSNMSAPTPDTSSNGTNTPEEKNHNANTSDLSGFQTAGQRKVMQDLELRRRKSSQTDPWFDDLSEDGDPKKGDGDKSQSGLTEAHRMLAFQYLILINEDLYTSPLCDMQELTKKIWSDMGSLYIPSGPPTRNRFLRSLLPPRRLRPDEIAIPWEITDAYLSLNLDVVESYTEEGQEAQKTRGITLEQLVKLQTPRGALEMRRPPQPSSFMEVLTDEYQCQFFRLFLINQGARNVVPLDFWKDCEQVKLNDTLQRDQLIADIREKYLISPLAKDLLLDEDSLRSLTKSSTLHAGKLLQVELFVKEAMERKWWNEYIHDWPHAGELLVSREGRDEAWVEEVAAAADKHTMVMSGEWPENFKIMLDLETSTHSSDLSSLSYSDSSEFEDSEEESEESEDEEDEEEGEHGEKRRRRKKRGRGDQSGELVDRKHRRRKRRGRGKMGDLDDQSSEVLSTGRRSRRGRRRSHSESEGRRDRKKRQRKKKGVKIDSEIREHPSADTDSGRYELILFRLSQVGIQPPEAKILAKYARRRSSAVDKKKPKINRSRLMSLRASAANMADDDSIFKRKGRPSADASKKKSKRQSASDRKVRRAIVLYRWWTFIKLINAFLHSLQDPFEVRLFQEFLRKELDRAEATTDKAVIMEGYERPVISRMAMNMVIVVNKLPADLRFWMEVDRYKRQALELQSKPVQDATDLQTLNLRATAIINCFLNSVSVPTVQINISEPDAVRIMTNFGKSGSTASLFHAAYIRLTPLLISLWKTFSFEVLSKRPSRKGDDSLCPYVGDTPHPREPSPDFTRCTVKDFQTVFVDFQVPVLGSTKVEGLPHSANSSHGLDTGAKEGRIKFSCMTGLNMILPITDEERERREKAKAEEERVRRKAAEKAAKEEEERRKKELQEKQAKERAAKRKSFKESMKRGRGKAKVSIVVPPEDEKAEKEKAEQEAAEKEAEEAKESKTTKPGGRRRLPFMPDLNVVLKPPEKGKPSFSNDPRTPTVVELEHALKEPDLLLPSIRVFQDSKAKWKPIFDCVGRPIHSPRKQKTPSPKEKLRSSPKPKEPGLMALRLNDKRRPEAVQTKGGKKKAAGKKGMKDIKSTESFLQDSRVSLFHRDSRLASMDNLIKKQKQRVKKEKKKKDKGKSKERGKKDKERARKDKREHDKEHAKMDKHGRRISKEHADKDEAEGQKRHSVADERERRHGSVFFASDKLPLVSRGSVVSRSGQESRKHSRVTDPKQALEDMKRKRSERGLLKEKLRETQQAPLSRKPEEGLLQKRRDSIEEKCVHNVSLMVQKLSEARERVMGVPDLVQPFHQPLPGYQQPLSVQQIQSTHQQPLPVQQKLSAQEPRPVQVQVSRLKTVTDVVRDQVLQRLYEERVKLMPQGSALYMLKSEFERRQEDRWSARSRMMAYGDNVGVPLRQRRVTTPDIAETQRRRKKNRRRRDSPAVDE